MLPYCLVKAKDRKYKVWKSNPLSVEIWGRVLMFQKHAYIHLNPVRAGVCNYADYHWSSTLFYQTGVDIFGFLTHVLD